MKPGFIVVSSNMATKSEIFGINEQEGKKSNDCNAFMYESPNIVSNLKTGIVVSSGVSLADLLCSDVDSGNNAVYSISILSGDDTTNKFILSGTQLQTTSNVLDYEARKTYKLVVTATETYTSTPQFTGTAYVFVTVNGVNEFTPSINGTSPSTVTAIPMVAENVGIGTTVCRVIGSDQDDGNDGLLQYAIIGGSGNTGVLAIDKVYGYIYTVRDLDYETLTSHVLNIQIKDTGSSPRSSTYIMTITVTDVNDNTPSCSHYFYSRTLTETASSGTTVVTLNCSDIDTGTTLSYAITSGNTDGTFTISSAGVVTTNKDIKF
ncbi:hypothetical protein KUTeg_022649 [Tegillarca granosa]|uniref:Cadherin domain-containing protein n=1 Tax=Tegillarca granosa TaxID=220873 RepID=A0ABQ9E357_TEGGR|nr:hypothetical protein KUTeg_022649 [Tegillarca granosa]